MNENIKTFSLVIITICVFIMTIISVLNLVQGRNERGNPNVAVTTAPGPAAASETTPKKESELDDQPKTTVQFEERVFDFGKMKAGDVVKHNFNFTNTGSNPLVISEAHGSCGCTIPSYPKEPIPPGGKAAIEVQFNSSGKAGMQNKTVTITANTVPPQSTINIQANVMPKE